MPQNDPDSLETDGRWRSAADQRRRRRHHRRREPGNRHAVRLVHDRRRRHPRQGGARRRDQAGRDLGHFHPSPTPPPTKYYTFHATGLNVNDYYASVGSLHAFGQVDPTTGAFSSLLSANNAPGFSFSSPHGVVFIADPKADEAFQYSHSLLAGAAPPWGSISQSPEQELQRYRRFRGYSRSTIKVRSTARIH